MFDKLTRTLKDAADVLKHVKSVKAVASALLPASMTKRRVLNLDEEASAGGAQLPATGTTSLGASELAQALKELRNRLQLEAIDDQGRVDYAKLRGSPVYAQLVRTSRLLRRLRPEQLVTDDERQAFWINIYNVISIHGVIALNISGSVMELPAFFSTVAYQIGDFSVTPDEIENGVLRRNGPHPFSGKRMFAVDDQRLAWCPSAVDPRIHAALVCASNSCPPVRFYEPGKLQQQLDAAAQNYVAAEVLVEADSIRLPITFRYYASDFGGEAGIWAFIIEHAEAEQRERLEQRCATGAAIRYARYDWALNRQPA